MIWWVGAKQRDKRKSTEGIWSDFSLFFSNLEIERKTSIYYWLWKSTTLHSSICLELSLKICFQIRPMRKDEYTSKKEMIIKWYVFIWRECYLHSFCKKVLSTPLVYAPFIIFYIIIISSLVTKFSSNDKVFNIILVSILTEVLKWNI